MPGIWMSRMVGDGRLELPTSCMSRQCSHLSSCAGVIATCCAEGSYNDLHLGPRLDIDEKVATGMATETPAADGPFAPLVGL